MELRIQEQCDDACTGNGADLVEKTKEQMLSDQAAVNLSDIFKALGDPTRIKILYALMQHELCVHDLTLVLNMGQSAISHQLRYLRNLRIVKRRKSGKTVYYSVDDEHIEETVLQTLRHLEHS